MEQNPQEIFYREYYSKVFNSDGFSGWSYRQTHKRLERRFLSNSGLRILEIGAGQGEHTEYLVPDYSELTLMDRVNIDPNGISNQDPRIINIVADAENITSAKSNYYDRIISMCVLHHVDNPQKVISNIRSWLKVGGVFSLFLPSDPGLLNRLNRKLTIIPKTRKLGFYDFEIVAAREHKNHYWAIKEELKYGFRDCKIEAQYFPLPIRSANLSLFSIWHVTKSD